MAMNWLKGLVAPAAQFPGQAYPPGMQQQGGPPIGGAPPYQVAGSNPYGNPPPPMMDPMMQQQQPQQWQPQQWSQGTRTQGDAGGPIASPLQQPMQQPLAGGDRVAQLQHDVESLALFARTLLTMLEEKNIVTRQQFDETKKRLDMLDGKLDDR